MKKNSLYIYLGVGLAILLSSFKSKKTQPSVIEQNGKPSGQKSTHLIPGAQVYDRNMEPIYKNNTGSYLDVSVTGETYATYNIVFGMNFSNGQPGIVFKNETHQF